MYPRLFFGDGTYNLDIDNMNITTKFNLKNLNNALRFEMREINLTIDEEHFNLTEEKKASNDLIHLGYLGGNYIINTVRKIWKSKDGSLAENITKVVNELLGYIPKEFTIPKTSFNLFIGLTDEIEIESDRFYIGNNLSAECKGECKNYIQYIPEPPETINKHSEYKGFQFFLSDYTTNSFMIAAYRSSLLDDIPISDVVRIVSKNFDFVKLLSLFFPEIRDRNLDNKNMNISITFEEPPITEFKEKDTNSIANPIINFKYQEGKNTTTLFKLKTDIKFKGWFDLAGGILKGNIATFNIIFSITEGKYNPSTKTIEDFVNILRKIIIPQINSLIDEGWKVPPTPIIDLSACAFTLEKQYLRIGLDTTKTNEEIREYLEWIINKIMTFFRHQKMQKMIEANIPKNLPKWIKIPF